jgi:hypothetical protein
VGGTTRKYYSMKRTQVYILWHIHQIEKDNDDEKLIGVYSSIQKARAAQRRTSKLKGFRRSKKGFIIDKYILDQDHWTDGFIRISNLKQLNVLPNQVL